MKLVWRGFAGLKFRERPTRSPILGEGFADPVDGVVDNDDVIFIAGGVHFGIKVRASLSATGVLTGSATFLAG